MPNEIEPKLFHSASNKFAAHLQLEGNLRTIFSGKFGSGKTTFLDHFFAQNKQDFVPVILHPVNYSIATNEDIFEYIKYDLLLEMLPEIDLDKLETFKLKLPEKAYLLWRNHPGELADRAITFLTRLGKPLHPSFAAIEAMEIAVKSLQKEMNEYAAGLEQKYSEHKVLALFIERIANKTSSLYEDSILVHLIEKIVGLLKAPTTTDGRERKVILIIEDLDRIDPEHIFRILNVFSAHFDSKQTRGENSFGIDTVVVVCDEENIRNIFANRYGGNVDYSGYIDKFFSISVFHYNFAQVAKQYIRNLVANLKIVRPNGEPGPDTALNTLLSSSFLEFMLNLLFKQKLVSLRAMNRALLSPVPWQAVPLPFLERSLDTANCLIVLELLILAEVCGNAATLKKRLDDISLAADIEGPSRRSLERLLAMLAISYSTSDKNGDYQIKILDTTFVGVLAEDENYQKYLTNLSFQSQSGSGPVHHIRPDKILSAVSMALTLIIGQPHLTLYQYGQF